MDTPTTVLERVGFPRNRHYTKVGLLLITTVISEASKTEYRFPERPESSLPVVIYDGY